MTTIGFEVEPHEVRVLLEQFCGDALTEPDDLVAFTMLTKDQATLDALVSAIRVERGKRLAAMAGTMSQTAIAEATGLGTQQRVSQLIKAAKL